MSKYFWSAVHRKSAKQGGKAIFDILVGSQQIAGDDKESTVNELADILIANKVPYKTNVYLSDVDVVDFMIDSIAIKIFLDETEGSIRGHVKGLCEFDRVEAVIAITDCNFILPDELYNKPILNYLVKTAWHQPAF